MNTEPTKLCRICGKEKPLLEMDTTTKNGKDYYRSRCRACCNERRKRWKDRNPQKYTEGQKVLMEERKRQRASNEEQDKYIYWDSRAFDRKAGFDNDLDRGFIRGLIQHGCRYCGETSLRMTLDRVDNSQGHTRDNVVPCCIRCNYLRGDMPYKAWEIIVKAVRKAVGEGAFGDWTGRVL